MRFQIQTAINTKVKTVNEISETKQTRKIICQQTATGRQSATGHRDKAGEIELAVVHQTPLRFVGKRMSLPCKAQFFFSIKLAVGALWAWTRVRASSVQLGRQKPPCGTFLADAPVAR